MNKTKKIVLTKKVSAKPQRPEEIPGGSLSATPPEKPVESASESVLDGVGDMSPTPVTKAQAERKITNRADLFFQLSMEPVQRQFLFLHR